MSSDFVQRGPSIHVSAHTSQIVTTCTTSVCTIARTLGQKSTGQA